MTLLNDINIILINDSIVILVKQSNQFFYVVFVMTENRCFTTYRTLIIGEKTACPAKAGGINLVY